MQVQVNLSVENNNDANTRVPVTGFKDQLVKDDTKAIGLLVKIDPTKESWGNF